MSAVDDMGAGREAREENPTRMHSVRHSLLSFPLEHFSQAPSCVHALQPSTVRGDSLCIRFRPPGLRVTRNRAFRLALSPSLSPASYHVAIYRSHRCHFPLPDGQLAVLRVRHAIPRSRPSDPLLFPSSASVVHHYRDQQSIPSSEYEMEAPSEGLGLRVYPPSEGASMIESPRPEHASVRSFGDSLRSSQRPYTPRGRSAAPSLMGSKYVDNSSYRSPSRPNLRLPTSQSYSHPLSSPSSQLRGLIVAEEERQVRAFQDANTDLAERLEKEMRRADDAERRAEGSERRRIDAVTRSRIDATARQQAEVEVTRLQEEVSAPTSSMFGA